MQVAIEAAGRASCLVCGARVALKRDCRAFFRDSAKFEMEWERAVQRDCYKEVLLPLQLDERAVVEAATLSSFVSAQLGGNRSGSLGGPLEESTRGSFRHAGWQPGCVLVGATPSPDGARSMQKALRTGSAHGPGIL